MPGIPGVASLTGSIPAGTGGSDPSDLSCVLIEDGAVHTGVVAGFFDFFFL